MILACTKPVGVLDHTCTSFKLLVPNQLEIASYGPALWCSYEYFCPPVDYHHLSTRFDFHWQYSSQERPTNILATLPLLPLCTDGGKVVSTLIILTDIARSTPQHGHQVMCIKWNKPLDTYSIHRGAAPRRQTFRPPCPRPQAWWLITPAGLSAGCG